MVSVREPMADPWEIQGPQAILRPFEMLYVLPEGIGQNVGLESR